MPITVGVLGGGQLGRMMAEAAHNLGCEISVIPLDPKGLESPASMVAGAAVQGSFNDAEHIRALAAQCDVLTVEIEHVNCDALDKIVRGGSQVFPSPACIRTIQDKYQQKLHFQTHAPESVALGPFQQVDSIGDARAAGIAYGFPFMLKARRGAYDGKGNAVVRSENDLEDAFASLGGDECSGGMYAEKWCEYVRELAVMVVCGRADTVSNGDEAPCMCFPVVQFTARNNICHTTLCPASISDETRKAALRIAQAAARSFKTAGVFGVEMFEMPDGTVLLNEVAPRPHNSGHYTIEACYCSQFEAHLRAVAGLSFPANVGHQVGASLMINVIGGNEADPEACMAATRQKFLRLAEATGSRPHWYGKDLSRKGRKMAHVTFCAKSMRALSRQLQTVADLVGEDSMPPAEGPIVGVIMGSDSDLPCMQAATKILEEFSISYEVTIVSAHRTPERLMRYAQSASGRGLRVIIAGAGGAAHLPGMVAAMTPLPVIGVPVKTSALSGVDSLYSIVQMPRGVPVATVAIGNATNAALLAIRILGSAVEDASLQDQVQERMARSREEVLVKANALEEQGADAYLASKAMQGKGKVVM
eukprot:g1192.t1